MNKLIWQFIVRVALPGILATTLGCVSTGDELPAVSEEGMNRVENTRVDALYVNLDADFSEFKRFAIADVDVSFRNWPSLFFGLKLHIQATPVKLVKRFPSRPGKRKMTAFNSDHSRRRQGQPGNV